MSSRTLKGNRFSLIALFKFSAPALFVEVTEVFKGKPVLVGQYVGIVEMLNDHNLEWVCNYGSKYETRPVMTAWNVREWPIIEVDEPGVLS